MAFVGAFDLPYHTGIFVKSKTGAKNFGLCRFTQIFRAAASG
jgi:hypothetical protein